MSNPEERACARRVGPDCKYLTTSISWWCTNRARNQDHGTTIPGGVGCPYYRPLLVPTWNDFWFGLSTTVVGVTMTFIFLTLLFALGTLL
jgi:hypothetical protein